MSRHRKPTRASRGFSRDLRAFAVFLGVATGAGMAALAQSAATPDERAPQVDLLADAGGGSGAGGVGGTAAGVAPLPVLPRVVPAHDEAGELAAVEQVRSQRTARGAAAREHEAAHRRVFAPVRGRVTSNYGPRWGTTHYGLDIANVIGTPIVAPMAGVVLDAGSASGFGLWVRIRHDDGTVTVYGHIDSYVVREGQRVEAGEVIAAVGNRGVSTGPHLHFEVWESGGKKVDPLAWLSERGAEVG